MPPTTPTPPPSDPRAADTHFGPGGSGATLLVVEDDPRVVELLQIALGAHGFRVVAANDGDEGWRLLMDEQPDLVILDVRLPKRSGLDLCESIRREPSVAHLPVILVSALAETEARLAGLARGADDYLPKPFSPKELVARVRRLLARGEETRSLVRRNLELAAEVNRSRGDLKRLNQDLHREYWIKDAFVALSQELAQVRHVEEVAAVFLFSLSSHLGLASAALLVPNGGGEERTVLTPVGTRGLSSKAIDSLSLAEDGELVRLLAGLGRPVRREELERFPDLMGELGPMIAAGVALCEALVVGGRLVGVVVTSERMDGKEFPAADLELARSLASAAAIALDNARLYREAEATYLQALDALVPAVESLDPRTGKRARNVAGVAASLARELGLPAGVQTSVRIGALSRAVKAANAPGASHRPGQRESLEDGILAVAEAYCALVEEARGQLPAPEEVARHLDSRAGRAFDRQITRALDDLLRRGDLTSSAAA